MTPSTRAQVITRRTYNRPLNPEGTLYETWEQTVDRAIGHQQWLWNRAGGNNALELKELRQLMLERRVCLSGRTLWLGGTEVAKTREASQFNCAFLKVETINDVVDTMWLLLQGCGVGFSPVMGTLNGFSQYIPEVKVVHTERTEKGGCEGNRETWEPDTGTWRIHVGDSAEAWAKSVGKLMAGKYPAKLLVLDFSELRPAGQRLAGYGWISGGDTLVSKAYAEIARILNRKAGQLLSRMDILDVVNWLGTVLSSRRSSEIALMEYGSPEWETFARAKHNYIEKNPQRAQSNNSLVFNAHPGKGVIADLVDLIVTGGGVEPGLINGEEAQRRAPWFNGSNPCGETLLANKSFCNLVEVNLAAFSDNYAGLERAVWIAARANYRQTAVNLLDGVLQPTWHQNNEFLRLCGVGLTGIIRTDLTPYDYRRLRNVATAGAYSMAHELQTALPKNVTTVKPSGTMSKIMDTTEGCHRPPGRYIFNTIVFSRHDPLVTRLISAGYQVKDHPMDPSSVLIVFPVSWDEVAFDVADGVPANLESAVSQLERYKLLMQSWCDQNVSITVSYSAEEVPEIVTWLDRNWDTYVGVTFMPRVDPTVKPADLGVTYLPQQVVSRREFEEYVKKLRPVSLGAEGGDSPLEEDCAGGACPMR